MFVDLNFEDSLGAENVSVSEPPKITTTEETKKTASSGPRTDVNKVHKTHDSVRCTFKILLGAMTPKIRN